MSGENVVGPLLRTPEGLYVLEEPVDLLPYQRDCSSLPAGRATQMVRPADAAQVAAVLKAAAAERVPVYVRGAGTMYAGGVNPLAGGVVLDVSGLDRILDIDLAAGVVVVEPGVKFGALTAALAPHGMTVGIIPSTSPAATVGGAASSHALGTGSPRCQSFADEVVGLEVVLASGERLRTGSAAVGGRFFHRYGMGPDLTGLFLGADGTLGVITALALWLHPLPEERATVCYGFAQVAHATAFMTTLQRTGLLNEVWYGSGYEAATIRGRVLPARPELRAEDLPQFCFGLDLGGDSESLSRLRARLDALASAHGGELFPLFNELYFGKLRDEQIYWYSYAGYFARSRCGLLMTSLPTGHLPAFLATLDTLRTRYPEFQWGGAVVVCRRGLHGGVLAFYDEARQWQDIQSAMRESTRLLMDAGCIPYKSGKMWAGEISRLQPWHGVLSRVKDLLDPAGILSPGNLGL